MTGSSSTARASGRSRGRSGCTSCSSGSTAKREDWETARRVAERCVRQVPHAYEGYLLLGEAALEQGDIPAARRALLDAFNRGAGDDSRRLAELIKKREDELRPPPD